MVFNIDIQTGKRFRSLNSNGSRNQAAPRAMLVNASPVPTTEVGSVVAPEEVIEGRAGFAVEEVMKELMRILLLMVVIASPHQLRLEGRARAFLCGGLDKGQCEVLLQGGVRVAREGGVAWRACSEPGSPSVGTRESSFGLMHPLQQLTDGSAGE